MGSNEGSRDPPIATPSLGPSPGSQEDPPRALGPSEPRPPTPLGLHHLPGMTHHWIGSFLKGIDFLNFAESHPSISSAFEDSDVWKMRVQEECTPVDPVIEARATAMLGSSNTSCLDRLRYSFHFRVIDHWKRGLYKTALTLPRSEHQFVAVDGNRIVVATLKYSNINILGWILKEWNTLSIKILNCATGQLDDYPVENPSAIGLTFRPHHVKLVGQILVFVCSKNESISSLGIRLDEHEKKASVIWIRKGNLFLDSNVMFNSHAMCRHWTWIGLPNWQVVHCYYIETGKKIFFDIWNSAVGEHYEPTAGGDWFVLTTQSDDDVELRAVNTRHGIIQTLELPMGNFQRKRPNALAISEDHLVVYHKSHIYIWNLTTSELIEDITTDIPSCPCAPHCPDTYISEACYLRYVPKIVQFSPSRKKLVICFQFFDRSSFLLKVKGETQSKVPVPKIFFTGYGKWSGIDDEIIYTSQENDKNPSRVTVWVGNVSDPANIARYTIDKPAEVLLATPTHLVLKTKETLEILNFLQP